MSISFIVGKPGGGKGLYSMQMIVDELVKGKRPIVTNLAIKMGPWVSADGKAQGGLMAYLQKKYGGTFDADRRIFILDDEQCPEFYRYRPNLARGMMDVCNVTLTDKSGACVEYDTRCAVENGGVLYVIDEAWKFFSARDWAQTGKGVLFYCAQHRKLGDDVLIVTQNTKQVDTAIRMVAQDYHVVRNHGKERLGLFRQPGIFSVAVYAEPPNGAVSPMMRTVFRLDAVGLGGSYDTSAGVGMVGKSVADLGERKKGVHWAFIVVLGIVGIYLAVKVPFWFGAMFSRSLVGGAQKGSSLASNVVEKLMVTNRVDNKERLNVISNNPVVPVRSEPVSEADEERITGVAMLPGGKLVIVTTKGQYLPGDPAVELVTRDFVVIRGRVHRW